MTFHLSLIGVLLLTTIHYSQSTVRFKEVAAETGLDFHHVTGATGKYYMPEIMGSGVALLDYDQDGDLDVYLVQGGRSLTVAAQKIEADMAASEPRPSGSGHFSGNRLFRNLIREEGKLRFTDVTETASVGDQSYGMGAAVGDYDNDGYPDLYVTNLGPNRLYHNNGDGTFSDVTGRAGVDDPRWSTSAAFLDYDRDGDLDLFLTNYVDFTVRGNKTCHGPTGEIDYCTPAAYKGTPDRLFRNEGQGHFVDVTTETGIGRAFGPGLGVICADFNADGWTDIYVANDGEANLLWISQRNGTFQEEALLSGAAYNGDGLPQAGMGLAVGDFDGDADEDILVTNLTREGSTLYRNEGEGLFYDATREAGLADESFLSTGFGVQWFDYDNDSHLDLFAANGAVSIVSSLRGSAYPYQQQNQLFLNRGKGQFQEVTAEAGPALQLLEVSRGAAFGDLDNDGDIDIVVSNNSGPARLLRNDLDSKANWLSVRLEGVKDNREGIGARVALRLKGGRTLWRRAHRDGSYLSSSDVRVHFGLGSESAIEAVEVWWPSGAREAWEEIGPNREVKLKQGSGKAPRMAWIIQAGGGSLILRPPASRLRPVN